MPVILNLPLQQARPCHFRDTEMFRTIRYHSVSRNPISSLTPWHSWYVIYTPQSVFFERANFATWHLNYARTSTHSSMILILQLCWTCMTKESRQARLLESLQPHSQGLSLLNPWKRRDPGIEVEVIAFSSANGLSALLYYANDWEVSSKLC